MQGAATTNTSPYSEERQRRRRGQIGRAATGGIPAHALSTTGLEVASRGGDGTWSADPVDVVGDRAVGISLAVGATGVPWLAYWDDTDADLRVAHDSDAGWVIEPVLDAATNSYESTIALDPAGFAYVVYSDRDQFGVWLATNASGAWVTERILPTGRARHSASTKTACCT